MLIFTCGLAWMLVNVFTALAITAHDGNMGDGWDAFLGYALCALFSPFGWLLIKKLVKKLEKMLDKLN